MQNSSQSSIKNHTAPAYFPARTSGSLGLNDQGDPNVVSLLGTTPGTLGLGDYADPFLKFFSLLAGPSIGILYKLTDDARLLSPSLRQTTNAPDKLKPPSAGEPVALATAQEMALKITTYFEGGKSMNYAALADDFDGQGTSFGLIQWNFGKNTLGPLLKKMLDRDSIAFAACFELSANYEELKKALIESDQANQLKWARNLLSTNRASWRAAFNAIGSVTSFNQIQLAQAIANYHPLAVSALTKLRSLDPVLMKDVQFRSYAALFDLCVQQHGIDKAWNLIKDRVKSEKPATQVALLTIAVVERAKKASSQWISDCISRRMGILTGKAYQSKYSEITKMRTNPQYDLIVSHGDKIVSSL